MDSRPSRHEAHEIPLLVQQAYFAGMAVGCIVVGIADALTPSGDET